MKDALVERLVEFKKESGWSYQKIANLLGIHPQTMVFWFNETYTPSRHVRPKVEEFLSTYSYNKTKEPNA